MKKYVIIPLLLLAVLPLSAKGHLLNRQQDTVFVRTPDLAWSVEFGYTQPWLRQDNRSMAYLHGGHVGAMIDWRLPNTQNVTLHSGLRLTQTFGSHTEGGVHSAPVGAFQQEYVKHQLAMTTVTIPIHVRYDFRVYRDWHVFVFGGPTLECGLALRDKVENQLSFSSDPEADNTLGMYETVFPDAWSTMTTGSHGMYSEKKVNPFCFMMSVGGGFRYKYWSLQAGYDFGLNNQSLLSNKKTNPLNKWQWSAGLSYTFH